MSGHSKWAGIKHKKAIVDAKRGQIFTKVAIELTVAAREGGGDPTGNFRLRLAIQKAKDVNMPADNIERAIQRGVGGKEGTRLEEIRYEGYGPHGVAVLVDVLTDNRNRTVAAVRNLFTRSGGSLGETNSVGWLFDQRGIVSIDPRERDPDDLALELVGEVDLGEEGDVVVEQDEVKVITSPAHVEEARKNIEARGCAVTSAGIEMIPKTTVALDEKQSGPVLRLLENLEELDDVQAVYANADIPDTMFDAVG